MSGLSSCEEGENVEHKIINKPSGCLTVMVTVVAQERRRDLE